MFVAQWQVTLGHHAVVTEMNFGIEGLKDLSAFTLLLSVTGIDDDDRGTELHECIGSREARDADAGNGDPPLRPVREPVSLIDARAHARTHSA